MAKAIDEAIAAVEAAIALAAERGDTEVLADLHYRLELAGQARLAAIALEALQAVDDEMAREERAALEALYADEEWEDDEPPAE